MPVPYNSNSLAFNASWQAEWEPPAVDTRLEHIDSLGALDRILAEDLRPSRNGSLFLPQESSLLDYAAWAKKNGEVEAPTTSEDVLDKLEILYSLEEFEKGRLKESFNTPPRTGRYMGSYKQPFYDVVPEDHPDYKLLLPAAEAAATGHKALRGFIIKTKFLEPRVRVLLLGALEASKDESLEKLQDRVANVFITLDGELGAKYRSQYYKGLQRDPIASFLVSTRDKAQQLRSESDTLLKAVKATGVALFLGRHPIMLADRRRKMSGFHWGLYLQAKKAAAPVLSIRGIDINRCYINELATLLSISQELARGLFLMRPIEKLEDLVTKGKATRRQLAYATDPEACTIIDSMTSRSWASRKTTQKLASLEHASHWSKCEKEAIWGYYRYLRSLPKATGNYGEAL